MVTSAGQPGVGATTVAVNLAEKLSGQGQRVVLVDADLDGASATGRYGLAPSRTLVDVLAGQCLLSEALLPLGFGGRILPGLSGAALLAIAFRQHQRG